MLETSRIVKHQEIYRITGVPGQRVPVELYVDESLLPSDECADRLVEIASHPSVRGRVVALPDIFCKNKNYVPGGVVIATEDVLVPMFSGPSSDSMALFDTGLHSGDLRADTLDRVFEALRTRIGIFRYESPIISEDDLWWNLCSPLSEFLSSWTRRAGDLEVLAPVDGEEEPLAPEEVRAAFGSERAVALPAFVPWHDVVEAGRHCMGVIDGNSHFIELCAVADVVRPEVASYFGLDADRVLVAVHAGSADVGLIAQKQFLSADGTSGSVPASSDEGTRLRVAIRTATRYALANRLALFAGLVDSLQSALDTAVEPRLISDAPHDAIERIDDGEGPLFLHRKGAVRALPGTHFVDSHPYSRFGKPFFFPSAPGNDSFVMVHTKGNPSTFFTCSHGAGRLMTLEDAAARLAADEVLDHAESRNVRLYSFGYGQLASHAPSAFKPMDTVMSALSKLDLAEPVARVKPLAIFKT